MTPPATSNPAPREAAPDSPKYWAFISYSHRDTKWAEWLHRGLESYHPPKSLVGTVTSRGAVPRRMSPVFRDREELPSATDLGALINAALLQSNCQIVVCSPQAAKSKWVNEEILAFKRLGREDRIFCLIVGGEPNATDMPGREQEECFPPALRFRLATDGSLSELRTEPIAADARPGKDGKVRAKLKVIAGVLGAGLRRPGAARASAPQPPAVRDHLRRDGRHGHHQRTGRVRVVSAQFSAAPDGPRRGGSRDRAPDDQLPGGSFQDLGPQRGARQQRHRARDARQGCGTHQHRTGQPTGDSGHVEGHAGHGVHGTWPVRPGAAVAGRSARDAPTDQGHRADRTDRLLLAPRLAADVAGRLQRGRAGLSASATAPRDPTQYPTHPRGSCQGAVRAWRGAWLRRALHRGPCEP